MPQSLIKNYVHITFSTKNRHPLIIPEVREELFKYLGGIGKNLECYPVIVGGHKDHIPILCLLSKKIALMNLLEETKSHSSKWIKTKGENFRNFYWQNGYGVFSVNPSEIEVVKNYIERQDEHHKTRTYQEEYLVSLRRIRWIMMKGIYGIIY